MIRRTLAVVVFVSSSFIACGGGSSPGPGAQASASPAACSSMQAKARARLDAVLGASAACSSDADCATVDFGAACFDSCSRSIAKSGVAAFEDARKGASNEECAAYAAAGCPNPEVPPCAPPATPRCEAGKCI